jgi:hypothetical protein
MYIDYSELNGVEVLLLLLSSRDGLFLWAIMGFALIVILLSVYLDKHDDDIAKHIDPVDQSRNM